RSYGDWSSDVCSSDLAPRARRGEVELEVARRVPRERGDPTVGGDAEGVERAGQTAGPLRPFAVRHALADRPTVATLYRRGGDDEIGRRRVGKGGRSRG